MRRSLSIAIAALFAALYALITITQTVIVGPLAYGLVQVRVSDALLPLAMIFGIPSAVGLCIGTVVSNSYYFIGPVDIIFGSVANLIAGFLSAKYSKGNPLLAAAYPVVVVTLVVGTYLPELLFIDAPLWLFYISMFVGEFIACMLIGVPLLKAVQGALGRKKIE
jgi:uncharacterized membrane protein